MTSRPCIIDIEASGFGQDSYPIEIGVVMDSGHRFCRLVKPAPHWTHWDNSAQSLHKISRDTLEKRGHSPRKIAQELNTLLGERRIYSDGWVVDEPWIIRLFDEAKVSRTFAFYDIQTILNEAQMSIWHAEKTRILEEFHLPRHRATNDAFIIQETFVRTLARAAGSWPDYA